MPRVVVLLLGVPLAAAVACATPVLFTGSSGSLSASVSFDIVGGQLVVALTNTSTVDVMNPSEVLTAVFFDITGDPTLTRASAVLGGGSSVYYGPANGGNVGGEWAYRSGLSGAPGGAMEGISSTGLGLFGPPDLFPGPNLQGPVSPDGLQYGLTSAGDDLTTGNAAVTGSFALIQDAVIATLGNLPPNLQLGAISNVWFLYGTQLPGPTVAGSEAADAASLWLGGGGLVLLGWARSRRKARDSLAHKRVLR